MRPSCCAGPPHERNPNLRTPAIIELLLDEPRRLQVTGAFSDAKSERIGCSFFAYRRIRWTRRSRQRKAGALTETTPLPARNEREHTTATIVAERK